MPKPPINPPVTTARAAALEALRSAESGGLFLRDHLHAVFNRSTLDPRDRALATQLATGTLRHRRTLRLVLSHVRGDSGRATAIQPQLLAILELGAFQLLFLDRVPAYAAVNEAVETARLTAAGPRGDKQAGFVNGVLRGVGRLIAGHDPDGTPARDALPHPDGGVMRLTAAVLPDPAESRAAFLGAAYSYSDWLVARWLDTLGDRTEEVLRWGNRRPRLFARVNPMQAAQGVRLPEAVTPGPRPGCVDVSDLPPDRLEEILDRGTVTVQDPSAMAAVEALAPEAGEAVLDLCASPGTKTTQIVERMGDRGRVVACDRSEEKLVPLRITITARGLKSVTLRLAEEVTSRERELAGTSDNNAPTASRERELADTPDNNAPISSRERELAGTSDAAMLAAVPPAMKRLGTRSIPPRKPSAARVASAAEASAASGEQPRPYGLGSERHGRGSELPAAFDAVLVDAPCSNTGVLARRPEARWRLRPEDFAELAHRQGQLLDQAAALVKPGGRLVYSTCSLELDENAAVIDAFLAAHPDFRRAGQELTFPGPDHDGAFWARVERVG